MNVCQKAMNVCKKAWNTVDMVMRYVPLVNVLWDIFFHGVQSPEDIKDFLNVQGLLSALLLAAVCSYAGGVGHGELREASERLAACWYARDDLDTQWFIESAGSRELVGSYKFQWWVMWSEIWLASNVLAVVWVYLSLAGLEKKDPKDDHYDQWYKGEYDQWFSAVRWLLLWSTICLIAGVVYFWEATYMFGLLKFPVIAEYERSCESPDDSPQQDFKNSYTRMLLFAAFFPPVVLSIATARSFWHARKLAKVANSQAPAQASDQASAKVVAPELAIQDA